MDGVFALVPEVEVQHPGNQVNLEGVLVPGTECLRPSAAAEWKSQARKVCFL